MYKYKIQNTIDHQLGKFRRNQLIIIEIYKVERLPSLPQLPGMVYKCALDECVYKYYDAST